MRESTAMPDLIYDAAQPMPRLIEIMRRLRDPDTGCPWDIEQDFASIAPYTIEEAYEVADAIERGDMDELKGELGDLLLQTVYHTQMGSEAGLDPEAALRAANAKFTRRFEGVEAKLAALGKTPKDSSLEEMDALWDAVKAESRA